MTSLDKILAGGMIAAFVGGVLVGRLGAPPPVAAISVSKAETLQNKVTAATAVDKKVDHRDIVTTTTKKNDGSIVTVVTDHSLVTDKKRDDSTFVSSSDTKSSSTSTTYAARQASWSLGLSYQPQFAWSGSPHNPVAFMPEIGMRLVGGLWISAAYHFDSHSTSFGFRLEF